MERDVQVTLDLEVGNFVSQSSVLLPIFHDQCWSLPLYPPCIQMPSHEKCLMLETHTGAIHVIS